jgi:hypothetical protein
VTTSYDKSVAVVVLPPVAGGRLTDPGLRAWLAQADLSVDAEPQELLARILSILHLPYPDTGLAALRMWGQTGDRPTVWIAGADPVYLEPRLDHLCLHALERHGIPPADLRPLYDHLQDALGDGKRIGFARMGPCGYLRTDTPVATAAVSAGVLDGRVPNDYLPAGEAAASHRHMIGEIEMALHEHPVNERRIAAGRQPVNSLWLWGGGEAPQKTTRPQPPLFTDEPLLLGYWESATALAEYWPGSMTACAEASVAGFVAVPPEHGQHAGQLAAWLTELRDLLRARKVARLTLLFRDGLRADITRAQVLKFWRRDSALLA